MTMNNSHRAARKRRSAPLLQRREPVSDLLLALCLTILIFSASVVLVLNSGWLYDLDIRYLEIEQKANMPADVIRMNYEALIRYNQFWYRGDLQFPTLPMSESGRIHFEEVKRIFVLIQYLGIASLIISMAGFWWKRSRRQYGYLKLAGILTIIIPVILGALAARNWDWFFVTFHKLAFRNDYWIFDPATDPVILMLPDRYFLHCAALILAGILLGSVTCFGIYRRLKRFSGGHRRRRYRS